MSSVQWNGKGLAEPDPSLAMPAAPTPEGLTEAEGLADWPCPSPALPEAPAPAEQALRRPQRVGMAGTMEGNVRQRKCRPEPRLRINSIASYNIIAVDISKSSGGCCSSICNRSRFFLGPTQHMQYQTRIHSRSTTSDSKMVSD